MLDKKQSDKWYFKTSILIVAFLCIGPFALPLIWINPRFSLKSKIVISIIVIILSFYSGILVLKSINNIREYYQTIFK